MPTCKTILTQLEQNNAMIKKYGVSRIGLFGSYLRNEQKPTSDIDILVEFEKKCGRSAYRKRIEVS